ncbi:hypothetical protein LINPERHAP2_LOCUS11153 [Linum perenne]
MTIIPFLRRIRSSVHGVSKQGCYQRWFLAWFLMMVDGLKNGGAGGSRRLFPSCSNQLISVPDLLLSRWSLVAALMV